MKTNRTPYPEGRGIAGGPEPRDAGPVKPAPGKAWLLAARPKTLAGAAVPVLIGCALAQADGSFRPVPALLCTLFAFLMQIDANFINDLYDFLRGSDRADRLGPARACAQGWITEKGMKRGIAWTTLAACAAGSGLLFYGGPVLIAVGAVCVAFAFLYTAGPYPLAYYGWGDLLVVVFFGLVPVAGTYFVMSGTLAPPVWLAALCCGIIIDTLLMINNYRDMEQDAVSGKRTLAVRLGPRAGRWLYLLTGAAGALGCLFFLAYGRVWAAWLPQLYLIPHWICWRRMIAVGKGSGLNVILGETSRNMLLFGVLLAAGLLLSGAGR